jgi:hypothetical protein
VRNPDLAGVHNENDFNMLTGMAAPSPPFQLTGSNPGKSERFLLSDTVLIILSKFSFKPLP